MDKPKFVLLIEKKIVIPEDIKIFLEGFLAEFPKDEYSVVETNSVHILNHMETLGRIAKVRLIDDLGAAVRHYFGLKEGCDLFVLSEGPFLRPCLEDYPFAEPAMEFYAKDNRAISLKVYKVDAHENPNLHYFR